MRGHFAEIVGGDQRKKMKRARGGSGLDLGLDRHPNPIQKYPIKVGLKASSHPVQSS